MSKKIWYYSVIGLFLILLVVLIAIYTRQATHFNSNVTINQTKVGGMTAQQALQKLETTVSKNDVYVGQTLIYNGKDTKVGFSSQDLTDVQKLLKEQRTFFPSSKTVTYKLKPKQPNVTQVKNMEVHLKEKLQSLNKNLIAPVDPVPSLNKGKVVLSKSKAGTQYDLSNMMKEFLNASNKSEIHLKPLYEQPAKASSSKIKNERDSLQALSQQTVNYKVQDKVYTLKGSDLSAKFSKDGKLIIDSSMIKKKLNQINQTQSTLHKGYAFQTHSGSKISVKGATYGWTLDVNAEAERILAAFENKKASLLAYNVYGEGWSTLGVGYHVTTNHGIGNTYIELSIKDQRIWVYKDGKLKVTTHVVTGTHIYNEDTPKGVWYVEYKQSPSVLKGSEVGSPNYTVKVSYWAPFTLSGCGFHDASWRTNWSSKAYISNGSGGCVNIPPTVMKKVYDNLSRDEPVVIY